MYAQRVDFSSIVGKTMASVTTDGVNEILFETIDGYAYKMYHKQDCCEGVEIEDIAGNLQDLVGTPILSAYESNEAADNKNSEWDNSATWTFYRASTIKGTVVIRWYGYSNGYYSETAQFDLIAAPGE